MSYWSNVSYLYYALANSRWWTVGCTNDVRQTDVVPEKLIFVLLFVFASSSSSPLAASNTIAFNLIIIIIAIDVVEEQSNLNWGDANQSKSIYIEGTVLHFKFENRLRRGERPSGDMSSNGLIMTQQFLWRNYILLFLWFLPWSQTLLDLQITSWECLNAKPKESKIINN